MGHERCLVELLRPLGVYDLGERAVNRGELGAYALGLDTGGFELEQIQQEMCLATAEAEGLDLVEQLLPYRPASTTVWDRRAALAALLRIGGDSFTLAAINDTLRGCGIDAWAAEGDQPGYVEVSFPHVRGIPTAFEALRVIIEEILPCHLEITYIFWFNSWETLALRLATWGDGEAVGKSWHELSIWK